MKTIRRAQLKAGSSTGGMIILMMLLWSGMLSGAPLFERIAPAESGLKAHAELAKDLRKRYRWIGSGVAVGDADGDGRADVFVGRPDGPDKLFRQVAPWKFQDMTAGAGIGGEGHTTAAVFVDIEGDGDLDLHVCRLDGPDRLYINNGAGQFTEDAADRGLAYEGASVGAAWMDYDRDGRLDVYVATHRLKPFDFSLVVPESGEVFTVDNIPVQYKDEFYVNEKGEIIETGERDLLLRNTGEGTFENVLESAGAYQGRWHATTPLWFPADRDAWPELFVANFYGGRDFFFANAEGQLRLLTDHVLPYTSWYSLGADVGDVNNDGELDFFVGGTEPRQRPDRAQRGFRPADAREVAQGAPAQYPQNMLYINRGGNRGFAEVAALAGVAHTGWSGATLLDDLDLDGREDLFIGNGMSVDARNLDRMNLARRINELGREGLSSAHEREAAETIQEVFRERNLAFANEGDLKFQEVGAQWGLDLENATMAAAGADLDRDGDVDLVLSTLDQGIVLYKNLAAEQGTPGLTLKLHQDGPNPAALGAIVTLEANGKPPQTRQISLNHGFMGGSESLLTFAGSTESAAKLQVQWPDGRLTTTQISHLGSYRDLHREKMFAAEDPQPRETPTPLLVEQDLAGQLPTRSPRLAQNAEKPIEVLARLSIGRQGPATAVGDVNGDGFWDIYLGGDAGVEGVLLAGTEDGGFQILESLGWMLDGLNEDTAALFLDADNDGDADLLVASGGEEYAARSRLLQNRLYWNNGAGEFEAAGWKALPPNPTATSSLAAADFDQDGDVDVFAGGAAVPGRFPQAEPSQLLRNDNGSFADMTEVAGPDLQTLGIIGDAAWSDLDGDGWVDLLIAEKWGGIRFFRNASGFLLEETEERGLAGTSGVWQGLVTGDFNGDGAMDFVVSNAGRNIPLDQGVESLQVYRFGSDQPGEPSRMVLAIRTNTGGDPRLFPTTGSLMQLAQDLPQNEEFGFWSRLSTQSLDQVIGGAEVVEEALAGQATIMTHSVFLNDGEGRFTRTDLPRDAQVAPGYGWAVLDLNADGHLDLVLAQNYSARHGPGAMLNAGIGIVLKGDGHGRFHAVPHEQSGLVLPENTRAVVAAKFQFDAAGPQLLTVPHQGKVRLWETVQSGQNAQFFLLEPLHKTPGARVQVRTSTGRDLIYDVGGGSYGQSPPEICVTLLEEEVIKELAVTWADGRRTRFAPDTDQERIILNYAEGETRQ